MSSVDVAPVVDGSMTEALDACSAVVLLIGFGSVVCTLIHLVQSILRPRKISDPEPGLLVLPEPPRTGYVSYLYQQNEEKSNTYHF